ncbi:patatin-like phospholipase family protein [Pseudochryseolinea flava]|uniref:Patatin n=1 Tax=Pseudochryseolinea flava TaxID=2059302 RepID=A0A364YAR5_9BACT|nr:patatin-like phospholipase family protein [Pseudochryseolinea flava]RAW03222.1 patatin [Pseudochryseolinea flava]
MKRFFVIGLLLLPLLASAQRVGLVLSGGASKGLAHVGVIKALEENDIPIDYVVGTSMGGIIGGCYAAGMSPAQIEHMVLSPEFLRWVNGSPEEGYNYYYHQQDINPSFLKLSLGLDSTFNFQFNSSIANDVSLNFVLAEKMAQASAISHGNFDSLFVPLRVVAADIFTQNEVILSKGSLSDALRATQTVPFFYTPIRVDGKYLFDGGVYNNFPVDIVQRDFNPDVIIGVNVSTKVFEEYPYKQDEKLISKSLLFLLLDKSDPSQVPETGVYIQPDIASYSSFDFAKAKSLVDSGYAQTIRQMPDIKRKVQARRDCDELAERRNRFTSKSVPFLFDGVTFNGFNSKQRMYIRKTFRTRRKDDPLLRYSEVRRGYFNLVSDSYFSNVYPSIVFNEEKKTFSLRLAKRPQQNFQVDFGGVVATRDISNIFLGLNYYHFDRVLSRFNANFQTGNFYKSALLRTRFDFPWPVYLEPYASFDSWNYLENDDLLQETSNNAHTILKRVDRYAGVKFGFPVEALFRSSFYVEAFNNLDRYANSNVYISTDILDQLKVQGFKAGINFSANTLNRKQYATAGRHYAISGEYIRAEEDFKPGNTSVQTMRTRNTHQWVKAKATAEQYFGGGRYHFGYLVEGVISTQPVFQNYFGTIIHAPGFFPIQDSRTLILQNFRSFSYGAVGLRNVFTFYNRFDFRLEGYLFKPFRHIHEGLSQKAIVSDDIRSLYFAGSAALVYHSPLGPISLSTNYYDDEENQLGVLLHVGFLLFNKHPFD